MDSMICSRFLARPAVPKSRLEKDGVMADVVADSGGAFWTEEGEGSARVPRKELSNALVRILRGISSRMVENVRRWLIRLSNMSISRYKLNPTKINCLVVLKFAFL